MTNDFDIEKVRARLIALRTKHGPDTPVGHRCSNLIEQLERMVAAAAGGYGWDDLQKSIGRSLSELAKLTAL